MKILHIPCLEDNYAYMIVDESSKEAAAVDPVEPNKLVHEAAANGVQLKFVLTTHHHWDHAGGNENIKQLVPGIRVYGGSIDNVTGCTNKLENGDKISLGAGISICSLHTPCHTKGHMSYYVTTSSDGEDPAVFTGDTLFIAGCGKFFEGTAEDMYKSLHFRLGSLPMTTRVYCGHEYTVKNLEFAATVEPDNVEIRKKLEWSKKQRDSGLPTIPSTIRDEMETNPFMRVDQKQLQEMIGCGSAVETLGKIREKKDNWRGVQEKKQYAVKNLEFAATVEPDNVEIKKKLEWSKKQRDSGLPTIPSTIRDEMETNPFMRVDQKQLQERIGCGSAVETLGKIREKKDNWRGVQEKKQEN